MTEEIQHVVTAVIEMPGKRKRYLTGLRAKDDKAFPEFWEFPGGKVDPGEGFRAALQRELREEIAVTVPMREMQEIQGMDFRMRNFGKTYELHFFRIEFDTDLMMGTRLNEHEDLVWLPLTVLKHMDTLTPGTKAIVQYLDAHDG